MMMTDKSETTETDIDVLLAQVGGPETVASGDLLARIVADADQVADQRTADITMAREPRRPGLLAGFLANFGGWPAMAGLVTATVVGVMVGYASPDTLYGLTEGYVSIGTGDALGDFMPIFTDFLDEG